MKSHKPVGETDPNSRIRVFRIGQEVKSHPATDRFMRGDVYGEVKKIGRTHIHVWMQRSGKLVRFHPSNLLLIDE